MGLQRKQVYIFDSQPEDYSELVNSKIFEVKTDTSYLTEQQDFADLIILNIDRLDSEHQILNYKEKFPKSKIGFVSDIEFNKKDLPVKGELLSKPLKEADLIHLFRKNDTPFFDISQFFYQESFHRISLDDLKQLQSCHCLLLPLLFSALKAKAFTGSLLLSSAKGESHCLPFWKGESSFDSGVLLKKADDIYSINISSKQGDAKSLGKGTDLFEDLFQNWSQLFSPNFISGPLSHLLSSKIQVHKSTNNHMLLFLGKDNKTLEEFIGSSKNLHKKTGRDILWALLVKEAYLSGSPSYFSKIYPSYERLNSLYKSLQKKRYLLPKESTKWIQETQLKIANIRKALSSLESLALQGIYQKINLMLKESSKANTPTKASKKQLHAASEALSFLINQDYNKALKMLSTIENKSDTLSMYLAWAYFKTGKNDLARKCLSKIKGQKQHNNPIYYFVSGLDYADKKYDLEARASFERAISISGGFLPAETELQQLNKHSILNPQTLSKALISTIALSMASGGVVWKMNQDKAASKSNTSLEMQRQIQSANFSGPQDLFSLIGFSIKDFQLESFRQLEDFYQMQTAQFTLRVYKNTLTINSETELRIDEYKSQILKSILDSKKDHLYKIESTKTAARWHELFSKGISLEWSIETVKERRFLLLAGQKTNGLPVIWLFEFDKNITEAFQIMQKLDLEQVL